MMPALRRLLPLLSGATAALALVAATRRAPLAASATVPAPARTNAAAPADTDAFTPVTVRAIEADHPPVLGTDGAYHVVYELELTNTKLAPATLLRVDVVDARTPHRVLASFGGASLLGRLRTLQPAGVQSAVIAPDASRLFYVELRFATRADIPAALSHHVYVRGAASPGTSTPTALDYVAGPVPLDARPLPVLRPPLAGAGWVSVNGCCNSRIVHRGSVLSLNGALHDGQRFAIDYMRLNAAGEFVHGDTTQVANYVDYGAAVLAVADARVVSTLDTLDDQMPGHLPDPASITIANVDGNHVVLDLGHGRFAFYAHLQKGSVTVYLGQHVAAGTVLGKLGNSGNTSGPHLHFHLMDGPSVLGSEGMPYVVGRFTTVGQVDTAAFGAAPGISGVWGRDRTTRPIAQMQRFPLNLNVIDFPGR